MSRLTWDGTAKPVSRVQILRREQVKGNIYFPCSGDHEQDWQPYPVDPYSCCMVDDHIYTVHDIITMQGHQTKQFLCTMLKTSDLPVALFAFFKTLTHTFWFYRYIYLYLFPLAFTYITCKSIIDATCKLRLLPLHQLL